MAERTAHEQPPGTTGEVIGGIDVLAIRQSARDRRPRPRTDSIPVSWTRPAEDVSDPIVAADRSWLVAVALFLVVISAVVVLIWQAGDVDAGPPTPVLDVTTTTSPPSLTTTTPPPATPTTAPPSTTPTTSMTPTTTAPPSTPMTTPPTPTTLPLPASAKATAPEDDDTVEPDPPPQ